METHLLHDVTISTGQISGTSLSSILISLNDAVPSNAYSRH